MTRWLLLGAAFGLVAPQAMAQASVIEIGADGAVSVRTGTSDVIEIGAQRVADSIEPTPDVPAALLTTIDAPPVPVAFQASLARAADTARVSPTLLAALVWQESRWRSGALSQKGARGLTQLMPATARALAVDPSDPVANLVGGARYLRSMLDMFDGNVERALAAYNAGPGRVLKAGGIPAITETKAYVSAIIDRLAIGVPALSGGPTR